jgi:glucose-6-phosphate isomerase
MQLSLASAGADWRSHHRRFGRERVLARLRALDACVNARGLEAQDPAREPLVGIGMEVDAAGHVVRNGYGVFNLAWQAAAHPEWAATVEGEAAEIRRGLAAQHGVRLRFVIWAGMGGSIEDKAMYNALGLLRGAVRLYALDSTDPAKLDAVLADIRQRARAPLSEALRSTLVVGMALGMTSYEPVVNLEALLRLYEQHRIDAGANVVYLTPPGSLLDAFAAPRGLRRVALQLDGRHSTSGRHSGPLTRGSLLPLALAGVDIRRWIAAADLSDATVSTAWKLASFLHAAGLAGRDKVALQLPRAWRGVGPWTKQDFEESLGKSEDLGIKIVLGESGRHDRVRLQVRMRGDRDEPTHSGRGENPPTAVLTVAAEAPLSRYMQFVHYTVFGLAYLRDMNFVTQPNVELYKAIAAEIHGEAREAGGIARTSAWRAMITTPTQARWRGRLTVYFDGAAGDPGEGDAAARYGSVLAALARSGAVEYGELTFFGDTRVSAPGRAVARVLARAGDALFRRALGMPVDVYEGPAVNHSYHEMIIGHGRCLSTIVLSARQHAIRSLQYTADYHVAQFLATRLALARRRRPVVAIVLKDVGEASRDAAKEFFRAAAVHVRRMAAGR